MLTVMSSSGTVVPAPLAVEIGILINQSGCFELLTTCSEPDLVFLIAPPNDNVELLQSILVGGRPTESATSGCENEPVRDPVLENGLVEDDFAFQIGCVLSEELVLGERGVEIGINPLQTLGHDFLCNECRTGGIRILLRILQKLSE